MQLSVEHEKNSKKIYAVKPMNFTTRLTRFFWRALIAKKAKQKGIQQARLNDQPCVLVSVDDGLQDLMNDDSQMPIP